MTNSYKILLLYKTKDTIKAAKLENIKVDKTTMVNNFAGLRDPKKRNRFKNTNYNSTKVKYTFIRSDLNGAYNIIRKVVSIEYNKRYFSRKCDILYTNKLLKQKN